MSVDLNDLDIPDSDYNSDELFQTKAVEFSDNEDRDFDYPLTAFVPKALSVAGSRNIPDGAAYWIIPDINDVEIVRVLKIFRTTFVDKVPAPFTTLYIRVDQQNKPNPTEFQNALWDSAVSKIVGKDGRPNVRQYYYLPVIRRYQGEWSATIGELSMAEYKELKKEIVSADESSDGRLTLATRPIAIWKPAAREVEARFDKRFEGSVRDIILEHTDKMVRPRDYVKLRARKTEEWFKQRWAGVADERQAVAGDPKANLSDQERFVEQVMDLNTGQMKRILADAGISISGARTRIALSDLIIANKEALEATVLAMTDDVPF